MHLSLHRSKCHNLGNHMSQLIFFIGGLGCCLFLGCDSLVAYPLFLVASTVCWALVLGPCFVLWFLVSFIV